MNVKNNQNKANKWNLTREFIIEEYVKKKKSFPKISQETGIPYETLFWYKKKFGIISYTTSFWHKGKRRSPKTEFKKGQNPWNKGTKGIMPKVWNKGIHLSEEYKKRVALGTKKAMARPEIQNRITKTQFKKGLIPWNKAKTNVYSEKTIEQIRNARLKQIFPKKLTNIEKILFEILDELKITYEKHKAIQTICQVDAFIKPNIAIFADGDYWHCNPLFYNKPRTQAQVKNIERDKKENEKLIKSGYIIIRFWECDLIDKKDECKNIISNIMVR